MSSPKISKAVSAEGVVARKSAGPSVMLLGARQGEPSLGASERVKKTLIASAPSDSAKASADAADLRRANAADESPSARVLSAIELLCKQGPMTYKELGAAMNMTRAATWRLVSILRMADWVCIREGGSIIQMHPRLDDLFATASFADAEFSLLARAMAQVASSLAVQIDLFSLDRDDALALYETTRRLTVSGPLSDLPEDLLVNAIRAAMPPSRLERVIAQVQQSNTRSENPQSTAALRRRVQQFPGWGWSEDRRALVVSVVGRMGTPAALRITTKANAAKPAAMLSGFNLLRAELREDQNWFLPGASFISVP